MVQGVTRRWVVAWSFVDLGSRKLTDEDKVFKKKRKRNSSASSVISVNVSGSNEKLVRVNGECEEEPKLNRAARRKLMMLSKMKVENA